MEKRKKSNSFDSFLTLYTEDFASAYSYYFSFPMSTHAVVVLWSTITGTILAMNTAKLYVHKVYSVDGSQEQLLASVLEVVPIWDQEVPLLLYSSKLLQN